MINPLAVVTGGAAGIGWEIGKHLVSQGYDVIAADLHPGNIDESSERFTFKKLDVTDRDAVQPFFNEIVADRGGIDVLINNAGIQRHRWLEDLSWEEWSAVVDVNLHGVFSCMQAAGQHMLRTGCGAIINIASVSARGSAGRAPYSATKAAVIGLTATAGAEWAARGIRVNAVAPGYVDTGVFRQGVEAGTLNAAAILDRIPADRLAQAEEIAKVVAFLASDSASYINGQTLYVDGGFTVDYGVPLTLKRESS